MDKESGIAVSCGVGRRCGSDPQLLWLWRRLEATAVIRPLAWEPPYALEAALEKAKRQSKQTKQNKTKTSQKKKKKKRVLVHEVAGSITGLDQWG